MISANKLDLEFLTTLASYTSNSVWKLTESQDKNYVLTIKKKCFYHLSFLSNPSLLFSATLIILNRLEKQVTCSTLEMEPELLLTLHKIDRVSLNIFENLYPQNANLTVLKTKMNELNDQFHFRNKIIYSEARLNLELICFFDEKELPILPGQTKKNESAILKLICKTKLENLDLLTVNDVIEQLKINN